MARKLLAVTPPVVGAFAGGAYFAWRGFWPLVALAAVAVAGWLWLALHD